MTWMLWMESPCYASGRSSPCKEDLLSQEDPHEENICPTEEDLNFVQEENLILVQKKI